MRRNLSGLILFVVVIAVAAFAVIAVVSKGRLRNIKFTDSNGVESTQIEVFAQDLKVLAPLY